MYLHRDFEKLSTISNIFFLPPSTSPPAQMRPRGHARTPPPPHKERGAIL
jgi:hypothetical protein